MILHHIAGTFGALRGRTLTLEPGLNVIEAPNEGGKSTWCALLRTLLYGINTRERSGKNGLSDKDRALPWEGGSPEGELYLTALGRDILLRRSSRQAPFDTFSAVDAVTGAPIPGLTADNAGEKLLGVGRAVYERSGFLRQGSAAALGGSDELEQRIAALVSSGEEAVSFSRAEGTLKEWLRRRRHNKTGLIPRLEDELEDLDRQLSRRAGAARQAAEARGRERELEEQLRAVRGDLDTWQRLGRQEQCRRYARHLEEWKTAEQRADALRGRLAALGDLPSEEELLRGAGLYDRWAVLRQQSLGADREATQARDDAFAARSAAGDFCFLGMTPDQAWQQADEDAAEVTRSIQAAGRTGRRALAGVLGGLAAGGVLSAVLYLRSPLLPTVCVLAGCVLFAALAGLSLIVSRLARLRHVHRREELLERYGADSAAAIRAQAADFREKCALADRAEAAALQKESEAAEVRQRCAAVRGDLLALVHPFAPEAGDCRAAAEALRRALSLRREAREAEERAAAERRIFDLVAEQGGSEAMTLEYLEPPALGEEELLERERDLTLRLAGVREELSALRGGQEALGDAAALAARREQAAGELERRRAEYDAISLALQALERAEEAFRSRISPELDRRTAALFSALTGGAYDRVSLSRAFEAQARPAGTLLPRSALALSQGTADQLYLAVRLALCSLLLSGEEKPPLVLDDALCNFDDRRAGLALQVLLDAAKERQVLLFTCQGRERELLRRAQAPCNFPQMGI